MPTGIASCAVLAMGFFLSPGNLLPSRFLKNKKSTSTLGKLWEQFYSNDWGDVTTNNYGFAPAEGDEPERFQLQMYREHLKALEASGRLGGHSDLLEVSCGRGGGLAYLVERWPGSLRAVGLDYSANALTTCRDRHGRFDNLSFVHGSALALPFPDEEFDVVLNFEASNDYGDYAAFYREVHRVLRPGGVFLHCDTRRRRRVGGTREAMHAAGLSGEFRDVTDHVIEACRQDTARRLELIRRRVPWLYRLALRKHLHSYAAVEGSRRFDDFRNGRRRYIMVAAVKSAASRRLDALTAISR